MTNNIITSTFRIRNNVFDFSHRKDSIGDEGVINQIFNNLDYDIEELPLSRNVRRYYKYIMNSGKTPLIVDAGANIGASAIYFHYTYPFSSILAVEPEKHNCDIFKINCKDIDSITLLEGGIASKDGEMAVIDPGISDWGFRLSSANKTPNEDIVKVFSMNNIMEEKHKTGFPAFIVKIDIEGGESELFSESTEWLDFVPLLIIELHDWMLPGTENSKNFLRAISGSDFDFVYRGKNVFCFNNKLLTLPREIEDKIDVMLDFDESLYLKMDKLQTQLEQEEEKNRDLLDSLECKIRQNDAQAVEEQRNRAIHAEQAVEEQRNRAIHAEQAVEEQRNRATHAEHDAHDANIRAQLLDRQRIELLSQLHALESSISWRLVTPLRLAFNSHPRLARLMRRSAKLVWWSIRLELLQKLRDRHKHQQIMLDQEASTSRLDHILHAEDNLDINTTDTYEHSHQKLIFGKETPTLWFDQIWYKEQYDVTNTANPYEHFITIGAAIGYYPSALVKHIMLSFGEGSEFKLETYELLVQATNKWQHDIPVSSIWLLASLFVPEWHDNTVTPLTSFIAYLRDGLNSGVSPGPLFNSNTYLSNIVNTDIQPLTSNENAIAHWLMYGANARIVPTDRFDESYYRRLNIDIAESSLWGFSHFIQHGIYEGRRPTESIGFWFAGQNNAHALYRKWYLLDFPNRTENHTNISIFNYEKRLSTLLQSKHLKLLFSVAQGIEPEVGDIATLDTYLLPPYHDSMTSIHAEVRKRIPATHYDSIICVPWIRVGGADLVAGLLAKTLLSVVRPKERVLILRTDQPHFDRANWLPTNADCVDISDLVLNISPSVAEYLLLVIFRGLTVKRVFNVNSRLCWQAFRTYGDNLAATLKTYAYMFCWDHTASGLRVGYPAEFFADTSNHLTAFLTDTDYLRDELTKTYQLPDSVRDRIVPLFTPAQEQIHTPSIARRMFKNWSPGDRPLVLWAGRLDRQKRFDLVQDIARQMPDVDFRCWGEAVLDLPPDLTSLPSNITLEGGFDSFDDLPLVHAGAWLFTSLWEGMPTTIIELAARGVPIVASAVGGVPELIKVDTGWPIQPEAQIRDYVAGLRDALSRPEEAMRRAETLQHCMASRYTNKVYENALNSLLSVEGML